MTDIKSNEEEKSTKQMDEHTEDNKEIKNKSLKISQVASKQSTNKNVFIIVCIIGILFGIGVEKIKNIQGNFKQLKPKYWVLSRLKNEDYVLKHVHSVLERFEYDRTTNATPWDLLWSHIFPFNTLNLRSLQPHQKVNHIPGSQCITQKVDFVTVESKNIPKSFRLPKEKQNFLKYAEENKKAIFVEKHNQHRGVMLKNISDVDIGGEKFVQEYIQNPLLVGGYKFDIGVYVVITSVNPLRIYYYNGDVLLRFCPEKYHPFDPLNLKKYVVADDYRPIWEVPALAQMHNMGYNMKESLNLYLQSQGRDPNVIWEDVFNVIRDNLVSKEKYMIEALKTYSSPTNFFEMFRLDLMLDEDMKVYLMEANMSPNLVSPKPTNQLLYEQVLFNLFSLVGLGAPYRNFHSSFSKIDCGHNATNAYYSSCVKNKAAAQMMVADKNIAVWGAECSSSPEGMCDGVYAACRRCLTSDDHFSLSEAYREHLRKGDFKRLFPPPMTSRIEISSLLKKLEGLNPKNRLMYLWFQGKCNNDVTRCN